MRSLFDEDDREEPKSDADLTLGIGSLLSIFQSDRTLQLRADMMASDELMGLTTAERFKFARDWFEREGLLPEGTPLSWLRQLEHGWTSRRDSAYSYDFHPYPGPITVYRCEWDLDRDNTLGWPESVLHRIEQRALGWEDYCASPEPVDVCVVPGDHNSLVFEPDVERLAAHLRGRLGAIRGE